MRNLMKALDYTFFISNYGLVPVLKVFYNFEIFSIKSCLTVA